MTSWIVPREWVRFEPITKDKMNEISNNLRLLYNKSRKHVTVRGTGVNASTTSLTPTLLDAAQYTLDVELTGKSQVDVDFFGLVLHNTFSAFTYFDILIDNRIYASTLTANPSLKGLTAIQQPGASAPQRTVRIQLGISAGLLEAGTHRFQIVWWTSSGTTTFYEAAGFFSQFHAGEEA